MELCRKKQKILNFKPNGMQTALCGIALAVLSGLFYVVVGAIDLYDNREQNFINSEAFTALPAAPSHDAAKQTLQSNSKKEFKVNYLLLFLLVILMFVIAGVIAELKKKDPGILQIFGILCCLLPLVFLLNAVVAHQ